MSKRSILLVTQFAPPAPFSAARRTAGLVRYLGRWGHRVTVLTSAAGGEGGLDGAAEVVRAPDLVSSQLNWRRGQMDAFRGEAGAVYAKPSRLESIVVPDVALVTWAPFAVAAARRLAREQWFDCVITSSPPQSTHLVGLAVRRRVGAWIAELRDGWTFDPPRRGWPLGVQTRSDRWLEGQVARKADALVAATEPIAADLRDRFPGRVELITNGFDPEQTAPDGEADPLLDPDRYSVVHTGRLSVSGRDPRPLFEAVRSLDDGKLELVLAGPSSALEKELLDDEALARVAHSVGVLDEQRVRRLQRAADALLVVAEGASSKSVATGKLFEYLAAQRPILVLGEQTEAARIVAETGTGAATSATDPAEIAAALERLLDAGEQATPNQDAVSRYSYPELAARYASLIDELTG